MSTQQAFKSSQSATFNHKSLMGQNPNNLGQYQNIDEFEDDLDIRIDINAHGHLLNPIIAQLKREMDEDEKCPQAALARERREKRRQQKLKERILRIMVRKLQLNDKDTNSSGEQQAEK